MYTVLLLDEARKDIIEARAYYKSLVKGLEKRFRIDLEKIINKLQDSPHTSGFRFEEFRTTNLQIFRIRYITKLVRESGSNHFRRITCIP